jgi:hypothetical protein
MVASALALQGRSREAGVLVETTLALVEEGVEGPAVRDEERALFYRRLLLGTMEPIDAIALVRDRGNVDAIASFAVALAESGRPELGVEVARDAVRRIDSLATANDRPKVLVKATQALAQAGQTEAALSMARTIEEPEEQVVALAHAAHGFGAIDPERAQALADEVEELLMQLFPLDAYSTVRSVLRLTNVRLGQYAAAFDHPPKLTDADTLAIYTEVIRDDALRRDKRLRAAFQQEPGRGLGRLGLYVP